MKKRGFTLIEFCIIITFIGLAALIVGGLGYGIYQGIRHPCNQYGPPQPVTVHECVRQDWTSNHRRCLEWETRVEQRSQCIGWAP